MSLGLHHSTHDSKNRSKVTGLFLGHETGDDGVVGSFSRRNHILVDRIKDKPSPPILESETTPCRNYPGAKTHEVAIDERTSIPRRIHDAEIHRVAPRIPGGDESRGHRIQSAVERDFPSARAKILRPEQVIHGHGAVFGISNMERCVGKPHPHRFNLRMNSQ